MSRPTGAEFEGDTYVMISLFEGTRLIGHVHLGVMPHPDPNLVLPLMML